MPMTWMSSRWPLLGGALLLSSTLACTGPTEDPRAVSAIEPVNPTGTVTGQLLDLFTQAPIEGATVTLAHANGEEGTSASTATDGTFELLEVSASPSIGLLVEAPGYASAWTTVALANSAGNLAQNNAVAFAGPLHLLPLAEGQKPQIRVLDPSGDVLEDASVQARLDVRFLDDGLPEGQLMGGAAYLSGTEAYEVSGLPDLAGLAAALPGAHIRATVVTAQPGFNPTVINVTVTEMLAAGFYTVVVDEADPEPEMLIDAGPEPEPVLPDTPLIIVDGNVADLIDPDVLGLPGTRPSLPSTLAATDAISLTTSRTVDDATLFVSIIDGDDDTVAFGAVTVFPSDELNTASLTIAPPTGGWPAGEELNVVIEALTEPGSGPPQAPLVRQGTFLTRPEGAYALLTSGALVDNNGTIVCPAQAQFITLRFNGQVGGRYPNGAPALGRGDLLAARVSSTSTFVVENTPLDDAYDGTTPASVQLIETGAFTPSGYSDTLRVPFGAAFDNTAMASQATTIAVDLVMQFNDLATTNLNTTFGTIVARKAGGEPVGLIQGNVQLTSTNNGLPCVP